MESAKKAFGLPNKEIPSAGIDEKDVLKMLRVRYPHGHADFNPMTLKEMKLHSEKNYDYAAGGDPLGNFNRVASILAMYKGLSLSDPTVIALVYAMKQVDAALWMLSQKREGKIEDVNSRLGDVSVYVKLAMILHGQGKAGTETWAEPQERDGLKVSGWKDPEMPRPSTLDDEPTGGGFTWPIGDGDPEDKYTEHECWGGWSDGEAVTCVRMKRQRDNKRGE